MPLTNMRATRHVGLAIGAPRFVRSISRTASVERGTSNKALEAYHRRRVLDPHGINGDTAFDGGTIPAPLARARETARAREEEAKYRDKHAFVGENYNDL